MIKFEINKQNEFQVKQLNELIKTSENWLRNTSKSLEKISNDTLKVKNPSYHSNGDITTSISSSNGSSNSNSNNLSSFYLEEEKLSKNQSKVLNDKNDDKMDTDT
jgi:hypothetical protein